MVHILGTVGPTHVGADDPIHLDTDGAIGNTTLRYS